MKKTSLFCLALGLSAALCACGSAATETTPVPETDSAVVATESNDTTGTENAAAETESVVTEDAVPTSYLTGLECTEEEREQRPMAVMLNNIKAGTPQAGIGQASVIYEAPMEGADVMGSVPEGRTRTEVPSASSNRSTLEPDSSMADRSPVFTSTTLPS